MSSRIEREAGFESLVLEAVAQLDDREELTGHVAVLTPRTDLVVVELGVGVPERGRLRVLVDVALPAHRGHRAERAAAVDQRDRAPDPARELARGVRLAFDRRARNDRAAMRAASAVSASQVLRVRQHPDAFERREQRRDQRAERARAAGSRRGT